jgi:hypothetical protein
MKKLFLITGLALASVININAQVSATNINSQVSATVASESKTVQFTIAPEVAQQLLANLEVKAGTVTTKGTNAVIGLLPYPPTQAVIPMPTFVASIGTSNLPPTGYDATNFVKATFKLTPTGYVGVATFTKEVTP